MVDGLDHRGDPGGGVKAYDPFPRGRHPAGVRTLRALDAERSRLFPCEIWYPADSRHAGEDLDPERQDAFIVPFDRTRRRQAAVRDAASRPGTYPLVLFSHSTGGDRRQSSFLCTHLASRGNIVAALDHSETFVAELGRRSGETGEQRSARWKAVMASRVPDVRFLLDFLLPSEWDPRVDIDADRIAVAGHSLGGWTALALPDADERIRAVVAMAPAGASNPRPGVLPAKLAFAWGRDVPALFLVAENDTSMPLAGMHELFSRTPETKRMIVLRRSDHMHFMDGVEARHEGFRTMPLSGELAALQKEMRPMAELTSGDRAHLFVRGLVLAHLDDALDLRDDAPRFWTGDVEGELSRRGVEIAVHRA
ncbi:MAG TPA: hypothetical protein VNI57_16065 [Candidatus Saccharimonadales bacterium]|nr:hypothetical protein [Candidatus Saccharimonadales bacterium]